MIKIPTSCNFDREAYICLVINKVKNVKNLVNFFTMKSKTLTHFSFYGRRYSFIALNNVISVINLL